MAGVSHPPLALAVQAAKALGHPARMRLVAMLRPRPLCVCQMTAVLALAPSTVSAHLLELRRAGLVSEARRGKWVEYRLRADGPFHRLISQTLALVEDDPTTAADRDQVRGIVAVPVEVFCRTGGGSPPIQGKKSARSGAGHRARASRRGGS